MSRPGGGYTPRMYRSGTAADGSGPPLGSHICWTYSTDDQHRAVLGDYFGEALAGGEKIAYFGPRGTERRVFTYLADAGHAPERLLSERRLALGAVEDAYLPDGVFEPDAGGRAFETLVVDALDEGFAGLRAVGEAACLVTDPAARDNWVAWELRTELLAARLPFTALCAYDVRECGDPLLEVMSALHGVRLHTGKPEHESSFRLQGREDGGIALEGEIDFACASVVESLLLGSVADLREPAIDVSRLRFVDCAGMRSIVRACREIVATRGEMRIRGASPSFQRMWTILGYGELAGVALTADGRSSEEPAR